MLFGEGLERESGDMKNDDCHFHEWNRSRTIFGFDPGEWRFNAWFANAFYNVKPFEPM